MPPLLLLLAACQPDPGPATPTPTLDGAVVGIDVSAHQGAIDWAAVADDGVRFAFLKATEGATFTDTRFATNWREARAAGLHVGAYHYLSGCHHGHRQAAHFLAVVPSDEATLPAVVDVEPDARCNRGRRWADIPTVAADWLDAVEAATGTRPLVYASDLVHRDHLPTLEADRWVAAYSRTPSVEDFAVWQHTDRGRIDGIDTDVDRNLATASFWADLAE